MCCHLQWTWAECEAQLDLHRLQALNRQWRRTPPLAELVAAFMGYESEDPQPQTETQAAENFKALFARAGGVVH